MAFVWYLGQDVPLAFNVVNDSGVPANATTVTVTVTNPDATTQTPAPSNIGLGAYTFTVPAVSQAGTYLVRVVASGTGFTWTWETQFQVTGSGLEQVVDLPSVKAHLNFNNPLDTSQDDELRGFILAATPIVRDIVGPILPEAHTQFFSGGVRTIVPDFLPLISIQSVTEYYGLSAFLLTEQQLGGQMNAFAFTVDYQTGEVTRRTFGGQAAMFAIGDKNIKMLYTAGRTDIPYNVRLGALELIRHNWQLTQQGGRGRMRHSMAGGGDEMTVPIGFAVPDRVVELLAPHRRPPGIA